MTGSESAGQKVKASLKWGAALALGLACGFALAQTSLRLSLRWPSFANAASY